MPRRRGSRFDDFGGRVEDIVFSQSELSQEHQILRDTIKDFTKNEIAPLASRIDEERRIPKELLSKLPDLGLFGVTVPNEFGGAGADFLSLEIAIEEVSKGSGSLGSLIAFHNAVVCEALVASKNSSLKEKLLPKLSSGSSIGAFDFSVAAQEKTAKRLTCKISGSELVVNGILEYVVGASDADIFLLLGELEGSKSGELVLFALSKDHARGDSSSAFSVGERKRLLGMRGAGTAEISFQNLRLPLESLVHEVSQRNDARLNRLFFRARLAVAGQALGIGQASLEASLKYANERTQFNTKIANFYAVQDMIASDMVQLETSRALTFLTARDILTSTTERDSAIAKISASNAALQSARHAIRVHGGYGFTRDYPVERYVRDARMTLIYPESNEELKALLARSMLLA